MNRYQNAEPQSKKLIPQEQTSGDSASSTVPIGPKADTAEPLISVNDQDGEVKTIEIRCTCGEVVVIQCDYS